MDKTPSLFVITCKFTWRYAGKHITDPDPTNRSPREACAESMGALRQATAACGREMQCQEKVSLRK